MLSKLNMSSACSFSTYEKFCLGYISAILGVAGSRPVCQTQLKKVFLYFYKKSLKKYLRQTPVLM